MQLLLAELVLVVVAAALVRNAVVAAGVAVAGAGLLVFGLSRRQGRWWLEQQLIAREHRRRRRDAGGTPAGDDPRVAALRTLAPGLTVTNVGLADGAQVGVAHDEAGWYAVATLTPDAPAGHDPGGFTLDLLSAALAEAGQPGAVLQLVTQTVPATSTHTNPSSPASRSYQQLLARFGAATVPADREYWLVVRLDAQALAEAVADIEADLDRAPTVVAALTRRVAKSLRGVGIDHRLLDADGLLGALVRSCDLEPRAPLAGQPQPREEWSAWHSSLLAHRCFWIRQWPPLAKASDLLNRLSTASGAMNAVALIMVPGDDAELVDLRALVRVIAPADELTETCQVLLRHAREAGADLFPLDGEQGPAVYASAPTGGHAR